MGTQVDIYPTSRVPARWDVTMSVDPTNADSVKIRVGNIWYNADWVSVAVQSGDLWTRTFQAELVGVEADDGTLVPVAEDDEPLVEVKIGTTTLVAKSSNRVVVKN